MVNWGLMGVKGDEKQTTHRMRDRQMERGEKGRKKDGQWKRHEQERYKRTKRGEMRQSLSQRRN